MESKKDCQRTKQIIVGEAIVSARKTYELPESWKTRPEILLTGGIPPALHGLAPRQLLGPTWWNRTRRLAYASTNYHCIACGVSKFDARARQWLEAHEVYETDHLLGRMTYVEAVPVCHYCHSYLHFHRLQKMLDTGQIHHAKYAGIIKHGDSILSTIGLSRPSNYSGPTVEWSEWRLIVNDIEYKPLYRSFEEYQLALSHS